MKRYVLTTLTALSFALLSVGSHAESEKASGGFVCENTTANAVPLIEMGTSGTAQLCEHFNRLKGNIRLSNLTPLAAYTVWWVYIDKPQNCEGTTPLPYPLGGGASECDFDDFFGDRPQVVFGRMDSGVSPRNGKINFKGDFRGMRPSKGSEVWLFAFGHGPADYSDRSALARQLLTPEDPGTGAPHLGNVVDGLRGYPTASAVFTID